MCIGGGVRLPEHTKHCCMVFLLFMLPEHNKLYSYKVFIAFSVSRTQQILCCQCFHVFYASTHKKRYYYNAVLIFCASWTQTLFVQCFPAFSASGTQETVLFLKLPCFIFFQNTTHSISSMLSCYFLIQKHNKLYLFNAFLLLCFLARLCASSTPPSPTLPLDLARKYEK